MNETRIPWEPRTDHPALRKQGKDYGKHDPWAGMDRVRKEPDLHLCADPECRECAPHRETERGAAAPAAAKP